MRSLADAGEVVTDHLYITRPGSDFYWGNPVDRLCLCARRPPSDDQLAAEAQDVRRFADGLARAIGQTVAGPAVRA